MHTELQKVRPAKSPKAALCKTMAAIDTQWSQVVRLNEFKRIIVDSTVQEMDRAHSHAAAERQEQAVRVACAGGGMHRQGQGQKAV
ncbi:hypothetical protein FG002_007260 [Chitinimonas sp. BJB300]|nr:hypothetical protein FG002_007260 [Chitinimonas sp. BJB300]